MGYRSSSWRYTFPVPVWLGLAGLDAGSVLAAVTMQRWGLRGSILLGATLNAISGGIRYLSVFMPYHNSMSLITLYLGQSVGAIGQPLFTNFPAVG